MSVQGIKQFGSKSLTEVTVGGRKILYSYQTPVVLFDGETYFVTNKKFSKTTTRHINFYLGEEAKTGPYRAFNPVKIDQDQLEKLL
jgi:hypothetical protein